MWFRSLLALPSFAAWLFTGWAAYHASQNPGVLDLHGYAFFLLTCLAGSLALTALHWGPIYSRLHGGRGAILEVALSTLLSLAAVEVAVRLLDPLGISYYREAAHYHLDKIPDAASVFAHRPGLVRTYAGVEVQINELGMRDRPIGPKAAGEWRVLAVGDSVTFGWGARAEDTYASQLERSLAVRLGGPVRVLNAGVGAYNTVQELGALEARASALAPDLVLLMYVENDVAPSPPAPFDPWSERALTRVTPRNALRLFLGRSWTYRLVIHTLRYREGADPSPVPRGSEAWNDSLAAVSRMASFCRERGVPFAVFLYGLTGTPTGDDLEQDLSSLAEAGGFPFRRTSAWFAGVEPRSLMISTVDPHPNATGHAMLAEGIERALDEWGFLPGSGALRK